MKHQVLNIIPLLVLGVFTAQAQVNASIKGFRINDGALVLEATLANITTNELVADISDTKTLLQLPFPQKEGRLDSILRTSTPVTFVVFYDKDKMIDEPVMICDSRLSNMIQVKLGVQETYSISLESRCFSSSVIALFNKGKKVEAELYVLYRIGNKIYVARSAKTKVKIRK